MISLQLVMYFLLLFHKGFMSCEQMAGLAQKQDFFFFSLYVQMWDLNMSQVQQENYPAAKGNVKYYVDYN